MRKKHLSFSRMRKRTISLIVIVTVLLLILLSALAIVALSSDYSITGLENFNLADSTYSLTSNLLPSADFLTDFDYSDGTYHYIQEGRFLSGDRARAFVALRYNHNEYVRAKAYCQTTFTEHKEHRYQVGEYHFIEHIYNEDTNTLEQTVYSCEYPLMFRMWAFCDEKCELIFLGYLNTDNDSNERALAETDFSSFLEYAFSEFSY